MRQSVIIKMSLKSLLFCICFSAKYGAFFICFNLDRQYDQRRKLVIPITKAMLKLKKFVILTAMQPVHFHAVLGTFSYSKENILCES